MSTLINEFQPNPDGSDPTNQTFELKGTSGDAFSGVILSIENDGVNGIVDRATSVSGTFDANGLLTVDIPDLENPSFTVILTDAFSGTIGSTDIDTNDDGIVDSLGDLGTILDAIGIADSTTDAGLLYAEQLGGTNVGFTGTEPELVFRDRLSDRIFAVNAPGDTVAYRADGTVVDVADFDVDPASVADTFGLANPAVASFDLQITEIWFGQDGADVTEDWFEITNLGNLAWEDATDGFLFYDDESADPSDAVQIFVGPRIEPGESAVVVIGQEADGDAFEGVWSPVVSLDTDLVGYTDGSGLGQGGDSVTLWLGAPTIDQAPIAMEGYPDGTANSGQSYDVDLGAFSVVGNASGAVATLATGGTSNTEPAIGSPGTTASGPAPGVFTLELLHIADQEAASAAVIDAPNLSAVLNALRAEDLGADGIADNTLTLSSGDAFLPGVFFDASAAVFGGGGIGDIQIQNELGIQAMALGNHEFDFGTGVLAGLIDGSAPGDFSVLSGTALDGLDFTGTTFPYLSTNLDFSTDPNLAPLEVAGGQAPMPNVVTSSTLIDVNGENVGVVGATTPTLASITSPGDVGISPAWAGTDPTEAELDALAAEIQLEVDGLLAANTDLNKIVLLAHMQELEIEQALASRLSGVDIIVAAGSNTRLFDDDDRPRDGDSDQGQYPQFFTDIDGNPTAVVNTDGSYKYVGRLVLDFDEDGVILPASYDETVSGAYATDAQEVADLGAAGLIDPEIQAIADAIEARIVATEGNVFGTSDVFLNANRSGTGTADDPDGVRTQETNLGNLTADANLAAARDVDSSVLVSIKNGGGIRASIGETVVPAGGTAAIRQPNGEIVDGDGNVVKPEGGISQTDIQTTLAFNNGLTLLTLTRQELVDVLEHGLSGLPGVAGRFLQVSGVELSFDDEAPAGSRIVNAAIVDESGEVVADLVRDGAIADDPSETFRIVTLDFLAGGGDGYPFPSGAAANQLDLFDRDGDGFDDGVQTGAATFSDDGTEQDALAEYLNDNFNPDNGGVAFNEADTGPLADERLQNLDFTTDTVFPVLAPEPREALGITLLGVETFSGAEIVAFDPLTDRTYMTSGDGLLVIDAADPSAPSLIDTIDPVALGFSDQGVTSVAVSAGGLVAIAVPGDDEQMPGDVLFFANNAGTTFLGSVEVGPLPDSVAFNAAGTHLVVANEGESAGEENEPDGLPNPNGSVSIVAINAADIAASTVSTIDFSDPSITAAALGDAGVRINPNAPSAAADLEPEFVHTDGNRAVVTLQENNAFLVIDDVTAPPSAFVLDDITALGTVDHSVPGFELDTSNRDDGITIDLAPIQGLRMPDAIDSFVVGGQRYIISANEGDGRDVDESRGADLVDGDPTNGEIDGLEVDPAIQAALADDADLGRLKFSNVDGDTDGDGLIEELYSFGTRSFTIYDDMGVVVFDSGNLFEAITADQVPAIFNADGGDPAEFDDRSDDKGPEPEGVAVGEVLGTPYAFIGLERVGGIMVFDVSDPSAPVFDQYLPLTGNVAPEGLDFIAAADSPTGDALLAVSFEGTATLAFLSLAAPNIAPVGTLDVATTGESEPIVIDVLANDFDPDGDTLTITSIDDSGILGTVTDNGDGTVTFDPDGAFDRLGAGEIGVANFFYTITDSDGATGEGEVLVVVESDATPGVTGNPVRDVLTGSDGDDDISGAGGNDFIDGLAGDDILDGGADGDVLVGNVGDDTIDGGFTPDDISDSIDAGPGNDVVFGSRGDDRINGRSGDDEIFGEGDDDLIVGGEGDDEIFGDGGAAGFFGSPEGNDTIEGNDGNDTIIGNGGADMIMGGAGNDLLYGDDPDFFAPFDGPAINRLDGPPGAAIFEAVAPSVAKADPVSPVRDETIEEPSSIAVPLPVVDVTEPVPAGDGIDRGGAEAGDLDGDDMLSLDLSGGGHGGSAGNAFIAFGDGMDGPIDPFVV